MSFRTTLIDSPWPERGGGKIKRGADRHYKTLDKPGARQVPEILAAIKGAPNWNPAHDAAHLWCWVTDNYLPAGLWLVDQLGFRFVRTFVWVKTCADGSLYSGIGQYGRGAHELLLFAVRGKGKSPLVYQDNRSVKSAFLARHVRPPKGGKIKHSAKPPSSYDLIESRSKGPYAELFARCRRPGWQSWGDGLDE